MKSLPIRRAQFKTQQFLAWLAEQGAEICTPTNAYEVVRYRAYHGGSAKPLTHIVYAKESGLLTFTGATQGHYIQFLTDSQLYSGKQVPAPAPKAAPVEREGPGKQAKVRQRLLARDGDGCWFCGLPMGDDQTIEHLVAKSAGGGNKLANYALAHRACNNRAADMPLVQKIELRTQMRAASAGRNPQGEDPAEGLRAEHEHAVPAEQGDGQ